ncbi:hypothetical protein [Bacillus cereus]|uniref:hypothetical protein n=1 Tax=Bacillus cereus TaxID=1396 RepID=UPI00301302F2
MSPSRTYQKQGFSCLTWTSNCTRRTASILELNHYRLKSVGVLIAIESRMFRLKPVILLHQKHHHTHLVVLQLFSAEQNSREMQRKMKSLTT